VTLAHWDFFVEEMETTHSLWSHGRDGPPSLIPHHVSWIVVIDVQAQSPFVVSGALHGSNGERVEAPSTPRIILVMGSETPLWFSFTVQLAMCRAIHLALSIFIELGQKSPSLTANLEYLFCPHCL
jgi:hypothetical protein